MRLNPLSRVLMHGMGIQPFRAKTQWRIAQEGLAYRHTQAYMHEMLRIWHSALFGAIPMALCVFTMERSWNFPNFGTSLLWKRK